MLKLINETVAFLKQKGFEKAEIGIVLGTGSVSYTHLTLPTKQDV